MTNNSCCLFTPPQLVFSSAHSSMSRVLQLNQLQLALALKDSKREIGQRPNLATRHDILWELTSSAAFCARKSFNS